MNRITRGLLLPFACGMVVVLTSAYAGAQDYPPCKISNCGLTDQASGPVLTWPPETYLLWYGNWRTGPYADLDTFNLVPQFISNLNGSVYESVVTTYGGATGAPSGSFSLDSREIYDSQEKVGPLIGAGQLGAEVCSYISNRAWALDPGALYLMLVTSDVNVSTAEFNTPFNAPYMCNGTAIHTAVVADMGIWAQMGIANTPHGNVTDSVLSAISRELNDSITDPGNSVSGYYNGSDAPITQMGDFCNWNAGATYLTAAGATANVTLNGDDYLLQTLRANENNGYCVSAYGGVFWGGNFGFGWSPVNIASNPSNGFSAQDWAPNEYKGECEPGQPLIGVSTYTSNGDTAHAVLCGSGAGAGGKASFPQSTACYAVPFDGLDNDTDDQVDPNFPDWDPNYFKAECQPNEFVAGVGQTTNGQVDSILCCPGSSGNYAFSHVSCSTNSFGVTTESLWVSEGSLTLQNSPDYVGPDWDYGYYKAQCAAGAYVAGVSAFPGYPAGKSLHSLLCCNLVETGIVTNGTVTSVSTGTATSH